MFSSFLLFALIIFPAAVKGQTAAAAKSFCQSCSERRNHKDLYADPEDCHRFYQCFYEADGSASGILRQCPKGSFWHDSVLQCLPEDPAKPCQDVCSGEDQPVEGCYADPEESCSKYFLCSNSASYQFCCPLNTKFNASSCTCDGDPEQSCKTPCEQSVPYSSTSTAASVILDGERCLDSFGNLLGTMPNFAERFIVLADDQNFTLACPFSTQFSLETCRCESVVVANDAPTLATNAPSSRQCSLYLPFDNDNVQDYSKHKFTVFNVNDAILDTLKSARGTGSVYFRDNHLEIPAFKARSLVNESSWCLYFKCDGCDKPSGLFSSEGSFDLSYKNDGTFEAVIALKRADELRQWFEIHPLNETTATAEGFTQICFVYSLEQIKVYRNNELISRAQILKDSKFVVPTSHCPLVVGSNKIYGNFTGWIDEVLVCDFALMPDEVMAHWAGKPSMINAGLIPKELQDVPQLSYSNVPPKPSPKGACGHSKYWNVGEEMPGEKLAIVGGTAAFLNEFPWQVHLSMGCGGSVISERFVLTAAHCCQGRTLSEVTVYYGTNEAYASNAVSRRLKDGHVHEKYDGDKTYDFCILEVSEPVEFDKWAIQPVCLPTSCEDPGLCQPTEFLAISGFGDRASNGNGENLDLMKAYVPVITNEQCENRYHYEPGLINQRAAFCAGFDGKGGVDACQGDSGGPAACFKAGFFVQQGVVSYGVGCGEPRFPGVYGNVCQVLDWIYSITGPI